MEREGEEESFQLVNNMKLKGRYVIIKNAQKRWRDRLSLTLLAGRVTDDDYDNDGITQIRL